MAFPTNKKLVTVSNIKFSCTIILTDEAPLSLNKDVERKVFSNFTVVRKKYVYTIFKTRNNDKTYHVNITKVPSREDIEISLSKLTDIISNRFYVKTWKINNLTCSFRADFEIPLLDVFEKLQKKSFVKKMRFNPERFPGMFVSLEANTILIFSTGRMIIIGAKTEDSAERSLDLIMDFFKQYKAERS